MTQGEVISATLSEPNMISSFTGWDLDFRQTAPGKGQTSISARHGELVSTLCIKLPFQAHQRGCAPHGVLTFGLPYTAHLTSWLNAEAPQHSLVCFGAGREFEGVSALGFEALTVSIEQEKFESLAGDVGLDLAGKETKPGIADLSMTPETAWRLMHTASVFSDLAHQQPDANDEEDLALALAHALAHAGSVNVAQNRRKRTQVVKRSIEVFEARADEPPSIRELCVINECSLSTLNRAFVEEFGLSPKAYISALRLNQVRKDLVSEDFAGNVSDAANRWGFWHMGQFAKDYRKLFGYLPSEHLNRC